MPSIFAYLDYTGYLTDSFAEKKAGMPRFSLRAAAKVLECDASFLAKILQGKKPLSHPLKTRLVAWLRLSRKEAEYFDRLLLMRKAKFHSEKRALLESLNQMRKTRLPTVGPGQYEYYEKWYYTAVLQLLDFVDCKDDYAALGRRLDPPITPAQARKSIAILEKLWLIKRDEAGYFRKTDAVLTSGEGWRSMAIANYQLENMRLARKAFEKHALKARRFSTLTLSLSAQAARELMEQLKDFESKCLERAKQDPVPDRVYQFNFQVFPISRIESDGEP
jgi:uncharacterized protein (TIGR02147 family)